MKWTKHILIILFLLLVSITYGQIYLVNSLNVYLVDTTGSPPPPENDFISQYLFNDDFTDEEDNYNGSAEGSVAFSVDAYEGSHSLDVGSNDEGSNIGNVDFGTGGFSISIWHKYANVSNGSAFVLFSNRAGTTGSDGFGIWLNTWQTTDGRIRVYTGDGVNQDGAASLPSYYNDGAYNHIVVVYEGAGVWTTYINGVDRTSDSSSQDDFATSGNTTVIGNWNSLDFSGDGLYDDARIYLKSLTQTEVTDIYNE